VSQAWWWNRDSQWHDSDVKRCQRDKHCVEDSADYSAKENKRQEHNNTSFENHIELTEHFCLWESIFNKINKVFKFISAWRFVAECKQLTIINVK